MRLYTPERLCVPRRAVFIVSVDQSVMSVFSLLCAFLLVLVGLFSAVDSPIFTNFVTCWARELVNCGGVGMRPSLSSSIIEGFRGRLWLSVGELVCAHLCDC